MNLTVNEKYQIDSTFWKTFPEDEKIDIFQSPSFPFRDRYVLRKKIIFLYRAVMELDRALQNWKIFVKALSKQLNDYNETIIIII